MQRSNKYGRMISVDVADEVARPIRLSIRRMNLDNCDHDNCGRCNHVGHAEVLQPGKKLPHDTFIHECSKAGQVRLEAERLGRHLERPSSTLHCTHLLDKAAAQKSPVMSNIRCTSSDYLLN